MNLWNVTELCDFGEPGHSVAYWSWGQDEAVEFWRRTHPDWYYAKNEAEPDVSVARPSVPPTKDEPHAETRREVLREIGWMCDGDSSCDTCGLYEFDGLHPICEDCCQCDECGCDCKKERSSDE